MNNPSCAGIPETLIESEFFGHVRGSLLDLYYFSRELGLD